VRTATVSLLGLALALAAGCGGGGERAVSAVSADSPPPSAGPGATTTPSPTAKAVPGSKAEVAAITTLAKAINTGAPSHVCTDLFTRNLVTTVFGGLDTCISADEGDTQPTTGATVSAVRVAGDTATAVITDKGGASAGAKGTWYFVRSGGDWQLDEWGVDYLRTEYAAQFGPNYKPDGTDDPFADAGYRSCLNLGMQAKDDDTFRTLSYGLQSNRNDETIGAIFQNCAKAGPGGDSPFFQAFEDQLRAESKQGVLTAAAADCVIGKLREAISESDLVVALLNGPTSDAYATFASNVAVLSAACDKGGQPAGIRPPRMSGHALR
jgi:hypothetical protein